VRIDGSTVVGFEVGVELENELVLARRDCCIAVPDLMGWQKDVRIE